MEIRTVLLIILAALAAIAIVFFQYFHKNRRKGSQKVIMALLRFIALFCALLLLINPKFVSQDYYIEKTQLAVLVDESESMVESVDVVEGLLDRITQDPNLNNRFDITTYGFGRNLEPLDTIHFNKKNTDISRALMQTEEVLGKAPKSVLLLSDGNQTLGREYEFLRLGDQTSAHPIVIGDTTQYDDLAVGLVNTNTYAFLKNKFPVEAQFNYKGTNRVSKNVSIVLDGKTVFRERLNFDSQNNSRSVETLIEATEVGVKSLVVRIEPLENERNALNNTQESAIEVIDEKTKIAIVSDFLHPDIGALKKSIESNEQREVILKKPTDSPESFQDLDLLILYQPNRRFKNVYGHISKSRVNIFTITGTKTDWRYLNQVQNSFFKEPLNQTEELIPILNSGFDKFGLGDLDFQGFPPLTGHLGSIEFGMDEESLLFQQIRGATLDTPLFSVLTSGERKEAVLFGEHIWKWRAQSYKDNQHFTDFDAFVGKLMIFLSSNNRRSRLELDYQVLFKNPGSAKIRASFYDASYSFDPNANLVISLKGGDNGFSREAPMLLKGSYYETDLGDLNAGSYTFTVTERNGNFKKSGSFKILDFNPEQQVLPSAYSKLARLAENHGGALYYPTEIDSLIAKLSSSNQFAPIQKSRQNIVSLIDFRILLGIIALALSLEWFIRKYNGLI
nr:VWA domain-containing protein [Allomuricauda sp.]